MLKKQCIRYSAIQKTHLIEKEFENFEVFHLVFLQQMRANQILSADLLRSSEDILDGKLNEKICHFAECGSIKISVFMEPRIAEKSLRYLV